MKKFKVCVLCAWITLTLSCIGNHAWAEASETVHFCINEHWLDSSCYGVIENETALVPIRLIADNLGLAISWDETTRGITVNLDNGRICTMQIDDSIAYMNDNGVVTEYELTAPPHLLWLDGEEKAVVPLRFLTETTNHNIVWEEVGKTVFINSPQCYEIYVSSVPFIAESEMGESPTALMKNDKGEEQWFPAIQMEANRQNGWYIKRYNYRLEELANQINQYVAGLSGTWGIYIKNLSDNRELVINDGHYSSASIIKLFVMAETYNELACGTFEKTATVRRLLESMITVSDNYSSNQLVKRNGGGSYERGFNAENNNSHSFGAINTQHKSLFIGYGDYVSYGRNLVSPLDCGILLEKIYRKELVSESASEEMLSLLLRQERRNKIPYPLPNGVKTASKTGETSTVESDVAIVYAPQCDYIICVLSNNSSTGITGIRKISKMTYDYFNK